MRCWNTGTSIMALWGTHDWKHEACQGWRDSWSTLKSIGRTSACSSFNHWSVTCFYTLSVLNATSHCIYQDPFFLICISKRINCRCVAGDLQRLMEWVILCDSKRWKQYFNEILFCMCYLFSDSQKVHLTEIIWITVSKHAGKHSIIQVKCGHKCVMWFWCTFCQ